MKIKRTLPSVQDKLKERRLKSKNLRLKQSYQFTYNRNHIDHISVIDQTQKQEEEKLALEILSHKPKIFKENLNLTQNSEKYSTNQSTSITERQTLPSKQSHHHQLHPVFEDKERADKKPYLFERSNSQPTSERKAAVSSQKSNRQEGLQEKIRRLEETVEGIAEKIQGRSSWQNSAKKKSIQTVTNTNKNNSWKMLEKERQDRCDKIFHENMILSQKLTGERNSSNPKFNYYNESYQVPSVPKFPRY